MSTFDSNELLGNALSIDHLHETIEKVKRVDLEDEEANLSSTREQRSDGNVTTNNSKARGSISSTLSSMKFSSMLGGFRADAEAKEKNLEAAEKAREARKILIAERAREKMEKEYSTSPVSRSLFGKDSRYRRASESRRYSIKKIQEADPAVMRKLKL